MVKITESMNRRDFLKIGACAGAMAGSLATPNLALATVPGTNKILITIFMNGGVDGLNIFCPFQDPVYQQARANYALLAPGISPTRSVLDIGNGYYGMNRALAALLPMFQANQLAAFQAVSTTESVSSRGGHGGSHFIASDHLNKGGLVTPGANGFMARLIQLGAGQAVSMADSNRRMPMLDGADQVTVYQRPAAAPGGTDDLVQSIAGLYQGTPMQSMGDMIVQGHNQSLAFMNALAGHNNLTCNRVTDAGCTSRAYDTVHSRERLAILGLLANAGVANIFTMRIDGHDTHSNDVSDQWLRSFAEGLAALRISLGSKWADTLVLVMSEFGRSVPCDYTNGGTSHGDAGVMLAAGGNTNIMQSIGGRIMPDVLNLNSRSYDNSLRPVADAFEIARGLTAAHLGLSVPDSLFVFPERNLAMLSGNA